MSRINICFTCLLVKEGEKRYHSGVKSDLHFCFNCLEQNSEWRKQYFKARSNGVNDIGARELANERTNVKPKVRTPYIS